MNYRHTQIGYLMIFILIIMIPYFAFIFSKTGFELLASIVCGLVLVLIASFSSLSVIINENDLRIKFGYGIFRKCFMLKEIVSVKTVKNHWYYGWGIRFWPFSHIWIYNVSGFDAVEIKMKDGRIYRIGTDEPKKLEYALLQIIK